MQPVLYRPVATDGFGDTVQITMFGLEVEDVVCLRVDESLEDRLLTPHDITGDDAAFKAE